MKKYNFLFSALLLVFCAVFLSSCEKLFNKTPEIEDQAFSIKENSPNGTEIGQIVATDKSGQELTYKIVEGDENEIFTVDEKTGVLSVNNSSLLNYESNESITIKLEVKDEFGKWDDCAVTISLINLPEIDDTVFAIPENSESGVLAGKVQTPDQNLTFAIISGNTNSAFEISNDGSISVSKKEMIDYEANPVFVLTVTAKNQENYSDTAEITINLEDVEPTTDHLLSYYKFNGNGNDETGYSNATMTNCSYTVDPTFGNHNVLSLDGTGYADLNKGFDYSSKSVSIWFKIPSINSTMQVIYASDHESYQYGLSAIAVQTIDGVDVLEYNLSGYKIYVPIIENQWYNAIAVLNNTNCSFYLNGALVDSGSISAYYKSNIGYPNSLLGVSRNFDRKTTGKIAEARFYTKALSAEEVHIIYTETNR